MTCIIPHVRKSSDSDEIGFSHIVVVVIREGVPLTGHEFLWGLYTGGAMIVKAK